jgi:hypothetical protein
LFALASSFSRNDTSARQQLLPPLGAVAQFERGMFRRQQQNTELAIEMKEYRRK